MIDLKPNDKRAKNAMSLIWIILFLEVVSLFSWHLQYDFLLDAANGAEITEEAANSNDLRVQIIAYVFLAAYLISCITFIRWFRRAYFNLHLRVSYLSHKEGWTAGAWFIPIVSIYIPYRIMKELYIETESVLIKNKIITTRNLTISSITIWWTLWIVDNAVRQVSNRLSENADTIESLITVTLLSMVESVVGIILALSVLKVIRDYSTLEPLLHEIKEDLEISE